VQPQPEKHTIQAPSVKQEATETFKLMITKPANHKDTTFRNDFKKKKNHHRESNFARTQSCKKPMHSKTYKINPNKEWGHV
jgi:hypothetical protein